MITQATIRALLVLGMATAVSGCKLAVIVTGEGDVESSLSETRNCAGGSVCTFEVTDTTYTESFTAIPREGYEFVKWRAGGSDFFCADSVNPTCTVSNVSMAGNAGIEAVIASFQLFHIMPIFEFVGIDTDGDGIKDHLDDDDDNDGVLDDLDNCPLMAPNRDGFGCPGKAITDTVVVDGKEWAQVNLFANLSWQEISTACPDGVCLDGSVLSGNDMTGWVWATPGEIYPLINYFIGSDQVGPFLTNETVSSSVWATDMFGPGFFGPTETSGTGSPTTQRVTGLVFGCLYYDATPPYDPCWITVVDEVSSDARYIVTYGLLQPIDVIPNMGAWFYRMP